MAHKASTKKSFTWHEQGEIHLQKYLKKYKNSKSCLAVLSPFGDPLLKAGKCGHLDWTSLGSIFSAVQGAAESLSKLLSNKTSMVQFGDLKNGFWVEWVPGNRLLVGAGVPYRPADLKALQKHLKSAESRIGNSRGGEALDGMTGATVDAAFDQRPSAGRRREIR